MQISFTLNRFKDIFIFQIFVWVIRDFLRVQIDETLLHLKREMTHYLSLNYRRNMVVPDLQNLVQFDWWLTRLHSQLLDSAYFSLQSISLVIISQSQFIDL